jgi:hypothetical protein
MKTLTLTYALILTLAFNASAQRNETLTKEEGNTLKESGTNVHDNLFKFGMSLGFNYLTTKLYNPSLSVGDNKLKVQDASPYTYLLSTCVIINPIKKYYRKVENGVQVGDAYPVYTPLSFVATVNLAQFGANETFNKKLDGGLGLGIRLIDDFHLALTAEMISNRQLRDYVLTDYLDKTIPGVDGKNLNALDVKDDRLFIDRYDLGFSVKFVYILAGKK